ncbi:MAG TPA: prevent-host-death protein [Mucilaginibacter sp.]
MSVTELKTHFSEVLAAVIEGETVAVTYGREKEIIGYFVHELPQRPKRILGILEGKAKVTFGPDWEMTTEEFLGLGQ